jgi:hypothetical protein
MSRKEMWGLPLLILAAWIFSILTLLFDVIRTDNWSVWWIVVELISFSEMVSLAFLARKTFLAYLLERYPSHWINVGFAALLGAVRSVSDAWFQMQFGLVTEVNWAFTVFSGLALGSGIFFFCGVALGARAEHEGMLAELNQIQAALLTLRSSSQARITAANETLANQTRDTLMGKIDRLQSIIKRGAAETAVVNLREFIFNEVRPLSVELSRTAQQFSQAPVAVPKIEKPQSFLAARVKPKQLIMVAAVAASMIFSTASIGFTVLGAPTGNPAIIMSLLCIPVLLVVKALIPTNLEVSRLQLLIGAATIGNRFGDWAICRWAFDSYFGCAGDCSRRAIPLLRGFDCSLRIIGEPRESKATNPRLGSAREAIALARPSVI